MQAAKNFPRIVFAADQYQVVLGGNNTLLGLTGNKGDYLDGVVAVVTNNLASGVQIIDGAGAAFQLLPNNVAVGSYPLPLQISSMNGAWRCVANNGVNVLARGLFTGIGGSTS